MEENQQLKAQLSAAEDGRVQAVTLLNDISKRLVEMAGKEEKIRTRQIELDPATWETSIDLRDQISIDLDVLQKNLNETRESYERAIEATNDNSQLASFKETISNLKGLLDDKERTIMALQVRMESLQQEAAQLREEVEEGREEIAELLEDKRQSDEKYSEQQKLIKELREIGAGYIFLGHPDEIEYAFRRREILRHGRTYHASEDVLRAKEPPRIFRQVSPEITEIVLGQNLRSCDILSVHKRYKRDLFYITRDEDKTVLLIRDPAAFWKVNQFLIVEIRQ